MNDYFILIHAHKFVTFYKLQSTLALTAFVVGVVVFSLVSSIVTGTTESIINRMNLLGPATVNVYSNYKNEFVQELNEGVLLYVKGLPVVELVSPLKTKQTYIDFHDVEHKTNLLGVNEDYFNIYDFNIIEGDILKRYDLSNYRQIAIIDDNLKAKLCPNIECIGGVIYVDNYPKVITGVLETSNLNLKNPDGMIWIPITSMNSRLLVDDNYHSLVVKTSSNINSVYEKLIDYVDAKYNSNNFLFYNNNHVRTETDKTASILKTSGYLISVMCISIAGIGNMNILMLSVSNRTVEIGIRKALGSKNYQIFNQIIFESSYYSVLGGILGIGLAYVLGYFIDRFVEGIFIKFSLFDMMLVLLVSVLFGLFAGFLPARKASKLDPIKAISK